MPQILDYANRAMSNTTSNADLNWIANYIWGIADDVLRDLYVRGKYRDVILPMTVLPRLDAVLETSKQAVLDMKAILDATCAPAPPGGSSRPTSRRTSTASRPTSRTSSTTSSSATRSRGSRRPTLWARESGSSVELRRRELGEAA